MKLIKGFAILLFAWIICLYLLFGPVIIHQIGIASREITDPKELKKYNGYVVKKLKTDIFGNWVTARKGQEQVVFRCDEEIFKHLTISKSFGR